MEDRDSYHENFSDTLSKPDAKEHLIDKANVGLRTTKLRWIVLLLACFTNFGNYFSFDNPQAVQSALNDEMNLSSLQFNMLYSIYSLPNIVLPLFGGLIIDRIGVRVALAFFPVILIIGQTIVTIGAAKGSYGVMLAGRVVFGLGGECLGVSQSSVTAKWFMGKELAFALGATLCISRIGSSLNSFLSPKIYGWTGEIYVPFMIGAILCIVSWVAAMALGLLDKKADEQEGTGPGSGDDGGHISLKDLKDFKLVYFLLLFNCFFLYGGFFGLTNNLNDLMVSRFGFTSDQAGNYIPIVYLCSAVITPMFGMYTDRKGKRVLFMLVASCLFLADHLVTAFLADTNPGDPNYGMLAVLLGIGLFYSTYAAIFWPCIPLVVKEKAVGTAYGIVSALQNLMLTIIPIALGAIHDSTESNKHGYFWTEITLAGVVLCGILVTTWIYIEDIRKGGKLNRPGTAREKASGARSLARSFNRS